MTPVASTVLLNMTESETFDFKDGQYKFYGVIDEEKSELLKDIVAFANAWKTGDAFIVIGVAEKNGRKDKVTGLKTFLQDNDVQQFVNAKTNRPVKFLIYSVEGDGQDINVIHIAKDQKRPIYLTKNFASLKKEVVYIRRGSSTSEASIDEIAEMGKASGGIQIPEILMEFEFVIEPGLVGYGDKAIHGVDLLKAYLVNHKGGLAQFVQGSVWLPSKILLDYKKFTSRPLEHLIEGESIRFDISNKVSGEPIKRVQPYVGVTVVEPTPSWEPVLPGIRLCVRKFELMPYREMLKQSQCSMRWQLSVNGAPSVEGETRFADIALIDRRDKN